MKASWPTMWISCCLIVCSCEDDTIRHGVIFFSPSTGAARYQVVIKGYGFGASVDDLQVQFNGLAASVSSMTDTSIVVTVPDNVSTGLISVSLRGQIATSLTDFVVLPGVWVKKASLPANISPSGSTIRYFTIGFVINGKLYAGIGRGDIGSRPKDWYVYEPLTDVWTRKADLPLGEGLINVISFSIGAKGYVGIGTDGDGRYTNVFLEYDPATDKWTRLGDFPGEQRMAAAGFSVGGKGYAGLGQHIVSSVPDWWVYDPTTDIWSRKADNPGPEGAYFARGFVVSNRIYVGLGLQHDWWEYSPATDTWTEKTKLSEHTQDLSSGGGFVLSDKGYIIGYKTCWRYDPGTNQWEQQAHYNNAGGLGLAASIGSHGYYINGFSGELWEFTPTN